MCYAIGIDFGLKRTGVAISDSNKIISTPKETIESENIISYLTSLHAIYPFNEIILGLPKKLNGADSHVTSNVLMLKDLLENHFKASKIIMFDERFTSKIAESTLKVAGIKKSKRRSKGIIDMISASIILQEYLNIRKNRNNP